MSKEVLLKPFTKIEEILVFVFSIRQIPNGVKNRVSHITNFLNQQRDLSNQLSEDSIKCAIERFEEFLPLIKDDPIGQTEDVIFKHLLEFSNGQHITKDGKKKVTLGNAIAWTFLPKQQHCCGKDLLLKPCHTCTVYRLNKAPISGTLYMCHCKKCHTKYYLSYYVNSEGLHFYYPSVVDSDDFIGFTEHTVFERKLILALEIDL